MDDSVIIELYFARDEAAIEETSGKYGAQLRRIALNAGADFETARECENDTYLRAWQLIPPHDPGEHLFAFLGRIMRGRAVDRVRREKAQKRAAETVELTRELEECLPGSDSVTESVERSELKASIDRFLDGLSERKQRMFVRRYWYFDPISDIAAANGMTESSVKTALHRMREQLKKHLEKEGYGI
jgi:RNA polymerase sigma-70 factor (ECF subfamily)